MELCKCLSFLKKLIIARLFTLSENDFRSNCRSNCIREVTLLGTYSR